MNFGWPSSVNVYGAVWSRLSGARIESTILRYFMCDVPIYSNQYDLMERNSNCLDVAKNYCLFINHDETFASDIFRKQKYFCHVRRFQSWSNCCFQDILIWLDRIQQAQEEYACQKIFVHTFFIKNLEERKLERLT